MFLTAHPAVLSSAFQVSTTYMPSNQPHIDPYVTSVQWSRRFLGLRLFLSLAAAGWAGYADHIEHSVEMARYLQHELSALGWAVVNDSALAVLCLRPPAGSPDLRSIVAEVLASGHAWVSTAVFEGLDVIRACVTHGETTRHDIDEVIDALQAARSGSARRT
jgi:glutamate/tyrosine decarboxylase-like PLP-dependent enzyme